MTSKERVNVLIVDDVKGNLLVLEDILKGMDLNIVKASSGNEALSKLLDLDFACVILDVQMPDMDGFELANIMREDPRARYIPILFASANQQTELDVFKGYETGGVDYLLKPLNPNIVRSKVHVFAELYRKELQQKRAEAKLAQYAEELSRSNSELEQFASVVAHDLKAPLRTMRGFAEALVEDCKGKIGAQGEGWLARIVDSTRRMNTLVDDLLMYSRVGQRETLSDVACDQIVKEVLGDLAHTIGESKAEIECDALPTLVGSATEFRQLFQNLIVNAIKYRKVDVPPKIQVRSVKKDGVWQFSIHDNGIGIDPKNYEKLFKIFSRLCGAEYSGTGIGLATCRKIVERRGGKIWVDSKLGEGSTFCFSLPTRVLSAAAAS